MTNLAHADFGEAFEVALHRPGALSQRQQAALSLFAANTRANLEVVRDRLPGANKAASASLELLGAAEPKTTLAQKPTVALAAVRKNKHQLAPAMNHVPKPPSF